MRLGPAQGMPEAKVHRGSSVSAFAADVCSRSFATVSSARFASDETISSLSCGTRSAAASKCALIEVALKPNHAALPPKVIPTARRGRPIRRKRRRFGRWSRRTERLGTSEVKCFVTIWSSILGTTKPAVGPASRPPLYGVQYIPAVQYSQSRDFGGRFVWVKISILTPLSQKQEHVRPAESFIS